jgi:hypothetical protein
MYLLEISIIPICPTRLLKAVRVRRMAYLGLDRSGNDH